MAEEIKQLDLHPDPVDLRGIRITNNENYKKINGNFGAIKTIPSQVSTIEQVADEAKRTASNAETIAKEANDKSDYTQTQLDQVTGASTIDPAVEQLKVGSDGETVYPSPDARVRTEINQVNAQLAENTSYLAEIAHWKLKYKYDAKALGGNTDDNIAIQNFIDDETRIFLPNAHYVFKAPVTINKSGVRIQGESIGGVRLQAYDNTVPRLFYVTSAVGQSLQMSMQQFRFFGYNALDMAGYNGYFIETDGQFPIIDSNFSYLWFNTSTSFPAAFKGKFFYTTVNNCIFEYGGVVKCDTTALSEHLYFDRCDFYMTKKPMDLYGDIVVSNCSFNPILDGDCVTIRGGSVYFDNCGLTLKQDEGVVTNLKFFNILGDSKVDLNNVRMKVKYTATVTSNVSYPIQLNDTATLKVNNCFIEGGISNIYTTGSGKVQISNSELVNKQTENIKIYGTGEVKLFNTTLDGTSNGITSNTLFDLYLSGCTFKNQTAFSIINNLTANKVIIDNITVVNGKSIVIRCNVLRVDGGLYQSSVLPFFDIKACTDGRCKNIETLDGNKNDIFANSAGNANVIITDINLNKGYWITNFKNGSRYNVLNYIAGEPTQFVMLDGVWKGIGVIS